MEDVSHQQPPPPPQSLLLVMYGSKNLLPPVSLMDCVPLEAAMFAEAEMS